MIHQSEDNNAMKRKSLRISRRMLLQGLAGVALPLPRLEIMGNEQPTPRPKRFCGIYTANGMCLPEAQNEIDDWSWFPAQTGRDFQFTQSTQPLSPFRQQLSFMGGMHHPNGLKSDPHVCSDMWLTGAPLYSSKNTVSLDHLVAMHTRQHCRQNALVLSIDAGVGFTSRTGTISFDLQGNPVPAENNPRRVFDRLFRGDSESLQTQRSQLQRKIRLVDAVLENSRALDRQLGSSDRAKMEQYLTSLDEVESRLITSEKWIDIPLKQQDLSHLNLDVVAAEDPTDYYRNMFDLIALAFDADITRSVVFMLNREDGMGISDTFPLKLGLRSTHHQLSHAKDRLGQLDFAKYDLFLCTQVAHLLSRLNDYQELGESLLDNTIVLYGSGASKTHTSENLPTLVAGGAHMGLQHGTYWNRPQTQLSDLYLSILQALQIPETSFADSTGPLADSIFSSSSVA